MWPPMNESLTELLEAKAIELYEDNKNKSFPDMPKIYQECEMNLGQANQQMRNYPCRESEIKVLIAVFDLYCLSVKMNIPNGWKSVMGMTQAFLINPASEYINFGPGLTEFRFRAKHADIDMYKYITFYQYKPHKLWREAALTKILSNKEQLLNPENVVDQLQKLIEDDSKVKSEEEIIKPYLETIEDLYRIIDTHKEQIIELEGKNVQLQNELELSKSNVPVADLLGPIEEDADLAEKFETFKQSNLLEKNLEEKEQLSSIIESVLEYSLENYEFYELNHALFLAIKKEEIELFYKIFYYIEINHTINYNKDNLVHYKHLLLACKYGYIDIVKMFIEEKYTSITYNNNELIRIASELGNTDVSRYLRSLYSEKYKKTLEENEMLAAAEKRKLEQKNRGIKRQYPVNSLMI